MTILEFTGKKKSEKYTTIRVKTSDIDKIKKAYQKKDMTATMHDIFTHRWLILVFWINDNARRTKTIYEFSCKTLLKLWVRILPNM